MHKLLELDEIGQFITSSVVVKYFYVTATTNLSRPLPRSLLVGSFTYMHRDGVIFATDPFFELQNAHLFSF